MAKKNKAGKKKAGSSEDAQEPRTNGVERCAIDYFAQELMGIFIEGSRKAPQLQWTTSA